MINFQPYRLLSIYITALLFFGVMKTAAAQQTDTSRTTKERKLQKKSFPQPYHSERSTNNILAPESERYDVPEPTEYYTPPFTGQKSLDRAVAAYRKEIKNSLANTPFFQFLGMIAPFITNQFEFGVYQINDLPIVERDNPYLYPQVDKGDQEKQE